MASGMDLGSEDRLERGTPEEGSGEKVLGAEPGAEPEIEDKETPVYLMDEAPLTGISNIVKWQLMHGKDEEELVAAGHNPNTVRICAQELEKDGHRERPKKLKEKGTALVRGSPGGIRTFVGGSPPEALINSISLPINTPEGRVFERGLKAGATLVVLGVRVAQELSSVGIQQAKPIMDMARAMREGEAAVAKNAALEAADEAASRVAGIFGPILDKVTTPAEGADPMRAMMVRTMEPLMKRMLSMFVPGANIPQETTWKTRQE